MSVINYLNCLIAGEPNNLIKQIALHLERCCLHANKTKSMTRAVSCYTISCTRSMFQSLCTSRFWFCLKYANKKTLSFECLHTLAPLYLMMPWRLISTIHDFLIESTANNGNIQIGVIEYSIGVNRPQSASIFTAQSASIPAWSDPIEESWKL